MITPQTPLTVCGTCKMVNEAGGETCGECGGLCFPLTPVGNDSEYVAMGDFAWPRALAPSSAPLLLSNAEPVTGPCPPRTRR